MSDKRIRYTLNGKVRASTREAIDNFIENTNSTKKDFYIDALSATLMKAYWSDTPLNIPDDYSDADTYDSSVCSFDFKTDIEKAINYHKKELGKEIYLRTVLDYCFVEFIRIKEQELGLDLTSNKKPSPPNEAHQATKAGGGDNLPKNLTRLEEQFEDNFFDGAGPPSEFEDHPIIKNREGKV